MDSIKIRRATLEDRKAVLRINENVYDGQDHLPFSYDELISSQEIMSVVMVSRERIVSACSFFIMYLLFCLALRVSSTEHYALIMA